MEPKSSNIAYKCAVPCRYTEVLQGAIELARVIVPDGTLDSAVDLATRYSLYLVLIVPNHFACTIC